MIQFKQTPRDGITLRMSAFNAAMQFQASAKIAV